MLRRALLALPLLSLGCPSSEFNVAEADAAQNSDASTDGVASDGPGGDSAPGPCDPEADKAKFCIEVKLAKSEHPPYTTPSGAVALGLDGIGRVYIALWDVDIAALPPGTPTPTPKQVIPFPSESGTLNVDSELPVTIAGSAPPGTYTVVGVFADNLTATRPQGAALAGDFVVLPTVSEGKLVLPKLTLAAGAVAKVTLPLYPNRRVTVKLGLSDGVVADAKLSPTTVHGDGPTMLALFDGDVDPKSFLGFDVSPCVNSKIQSATLPPTMTLNYTTTVEGEHNAFVALFDYGSSPFPGKGSLTSANTSPYPRIAINKDLWSASAVIDLVQIAGGAYTAPGPADPLTCP